MKTRTRSILAASLAFMIVFQPIVGISFAPFLDSVVYADEEEGPKDKPKPGVSNADDDVNRTQQGKGFPKQGSNTVPTYGNSGSGGKGNGTGGNGGGSVTDPVVDLDPTRPSRGNGDRGGDLPENPNGVKGGDPDTNGGKTSGGDPGDKGNGKDSNSEGDPSGEGSDSNKDNKGDKGNGSDAEDGDDPNSDWSTPGKSDGKDSDGGNSDKEGDRNTPGDSDSKSEPKEPIDVIKENIKFGKDSVTYIDLITKLENGGDLTSGDILFILKMIEVSDNEDVQKAYETLLSQVTGAKGVMDEVKDAHSIRYADRGKLSFKDWFKIDTYKDTFIGHTKDSISDYAYRTIYGEDKTALVEKSDSKKTKLSSPFKWIGEKISNGASKLGDALTNGLDRGMRFLGDGVSTIAKGVENLFTKGADFVKEAKETITTAANNAKTKVGQTVLKGVNSVVDAVDRGMTSVGNVASKIGKAGTWISNSSFGKTVSNAVTTVKDFSSKAWQSTKDFATKISNSKVGTFVKDVVNSPIGKIGSGALSALSIWSGVTDLTGDGPWNTKVSGGLSVVSGVLGIAGIVAAGTAAAPLLVAGAFVAGVGALAFTYGPKLVNAWNESKVGSTVNKAVSDTAKFVGDTAKSAGKAIAKTASNIADSISSGFSSLFGR